MSKPARLASIVMGFVALNPTAQAATKPALVIFAAASLKNALDEAAAAFTAKTQVPVQISYGGSLALARQLGQGAPVDVFISADQASMDFAASQHSIEPSSRIDLLSNTLVLIANRDAPFSTLALTNQALAQTLGTGHLATGDVRSVPVGEYAEAALKKLGLWETVKPHLALSDNVRAAMVFVALKEAPLGIVYATDAAAEPKVKVVATFPDNSHPPIIYPIAVTAKAKSGDSAAFIKFLSEGSADAMFEAQGFHMLEPAKNHS